MKMIHRFSLTASLCLGALLAPIFVTSANAAQATSAAAPTTISAKQMLDNAEAQAGKEHKSVFLIFHASWCIWCHRIDAMLNDPKLKPIFDKHFVIIHVDGMESPDKKTLENPGWDTMLKEYKGENQGIPYWLFLSPKGKILSTCNSPNDLDKNGNPSNMGFPDKSQPKDMDYFITVMKKAGAHLSKDDVDAIQSYIKGLAY